MNDYNFIDSKNRDFQMTKIIFFNRKYRCFIGDNSWTYFEDYKTGKK